ncbi:MAG: bifunctional 5,10-methylenetetrahydrofolate dehydrogenase/5,10-methenyltetrahydrofolate cyclohydrolase [Bacilli bacterium]|nr:bifunctional 5,10-methylenetetrahydrofolate dehydrogenase/5,10-methenyltetrahydrofolate cyclohydrolase [Bacilli bacterium]
MILDGKIVKKEILDNLKEEVLNLQEKPKLVVIQVGNNESSNIYINQKIKMCNSVGYTYEHIKLNDNVKTEEVITIIDELNKDNSVNGILVQMPLPSHLDEKIIQNRINEYKDVDGLTDINSGKLLHKKECLSPCTPLGIIELLKRYNINIEGKNIVVLGRSILVGKPLVNMLINENATVTVCHSKTQNIEEHTKRADILIVAIGSPKKITKDMVKENSIIIDVGITKVDNQIYGDVDFENVKDKVKYITPVPGGIGQMTVAMLAKNILKAYKIQKNVK